MTNATPSTGNDTGLPDTARRGPITEDDLSSAYGLSLAMEVCSDAMDGITDPELAARALSYLSRLQRHEMVRLMKHADDSTKGGE